MSDDRPSRIPLVVGWLLIVFGVLSGLGGLAAWIYVSQKGGGGSVTQLHIVTNVALAALAIYAGTRAIRYLPEAIRWANWYAGLAIVKVLLTFLLVWTAVIPKNALVRTNFFTLVMLVGFPVVVLVLMNSDRARVACGHESSFDSA